MADWFPTFRSIGRRATDRTVYSQLWQQFRHTPYRDLIRLHLSGRLNWRAAIAESGLPDNAQQKISDVVKATRLWRLEKAQIATELIAHFHDGLQQGQGVDHLVAEFGDTATVAQMMRSAKKRNRSIFWKTLVAGGYAFLAFLVFYAGLAVWFFSGEPRPSVDYFKAMSAYAVAVPEEQRAWPIYREAWIEHDFVNLNIGEILGQQEADEKWWDEWRPGDEKWPQLVEFLEQKESLVKAIRCGGQLSGLGLELKLVQDYSQNDQLAIFGPDRDEAADDHYSDVPLLNSALLNVRLGQVQQMRAMSRILASDVFRMAEMNAADEVTEDLLAMLGVGPQSAETPFLVCGLVGLALDGIAYGTIEELLTKYPDLLTDQQLKSVAEKLASLSPRKLIRVEGEIAFQKDLIQRIYTDDGNGDGRLTDEGVKLWQGLMSFAGSHYEEDPLANTAINVFGPGVAFLGGSRKDLEGGINGVMEAMVTAADEPLSMRSARDRDYFEQLVDKHVSNPVAKIFMDMMMPAFDQITLAGERTECARNAAMIGVAAYRFRLRHDRFPETANELVPKFLPSIPMDVITGHPLKYQLQGGLPMIYSVGVDLDDDGGVESLDSDGKPVLSVINNLGSKTIDGDWILWPAVNE